MRRFLLCAVGLGALLLPNVACAQTEQQTLVDRATLVMQEMMSQPGSQHARFELQRARAVMICPRMFKAGFFFGGEGGDCVLVSRAGNGTWSYPAFYGMGSGSFGFQVGIQDSAVLMMILTDRGLNAVLDSQFKLGANATIAVATIGGGVQGATTAAVGADIVAFIDARGLYGGVTLEGSLMPSKSSWNAAYYGQPYSARQIVIQMGPANPGADPLRQMLTQFGTGPVIQAATPSPLPPPPPVVEGSVQSGSSYAPGYPTVGQYHGDGQPVELAPPSSAPVQQQSLPPPGVPR
jgi:SH3 domain-containing YSC84-like protein 1